MANETNNFLETMVEAQKTLVNSAIENTKKFANGNAFVNETVEKGSEWYNNWLENQKAIFNKTTEQATETANTAKANAGNMTDFFQNWYNTQASWSKNLWETSQNFVKDASSKATSTNPMEQATAAYNNWMNQANIMFSNMNTANTWMNNMQQWSNMNPFSMDSMKNAGTEATNIFNQWYQMLNSSFGEWQGHLQNGTTQDAFRNMLNSAEGFTRFTQIWAPMWKSIQDKTFNADIYKNMMSPAAYQEFMDKFFGFLPENSRQFMQQLSAQMQNGAKQAMQQGAAGYNQFRGMFQNIPGFNPNDAFGNMLSGYQKMQQTFQNAVSPIAKMVTPNQYTKAAADWAEIADRTMVYNIKNAQMQYLMYAQGTKVMDALAQNIINKLEQGEEVKSMMSMYQEWMNISDKSYVALFESDDYSQLMAETSALQLVLRKNMEGQMEKALGNVPVATRSEMDELYKTIYELKKEVRQLSRMLEIDGEVAAQPNTTFAAPATETPAAEAPATDATATDAAKNNGTANNNNGRAKKA